MDPTAPGPAASGRAVPQRPLFPAAPNPWPNRKVVDTVCKSAHHCARSLAEMLWTEQQAGWRLHSWQITPGAGADQGLYVLFTIFESVLVGDPALLDPRSQAAKDLDRDIGKGHVLPPREKDPTEP